jgi:hypothetical protein
MDDPLRKRKRDDAATNAEDGFMRKRLECERDLRERKSELLQKVEDSAKKLAELRGKLAAAETADSLMRSQLRDLEENVFTVFDLVATLGTLEMYVAKTDESGSEHHEECYEISQDFLQTLRRSAALLHEPQDDPLLFLSINEKKQAYGRIVALMDNPRADYEDHIMALEQLQILIFAFWSAIAGYVAVSCLFPQSSTTSVHTTAHTHSLA